MRKMRERESGRAGERESERMGEWGREGVGERESWREGKFLSPTPPLSRSLTLKKDA